MNKERRKSIAAVIERINTLGAEKLAIWEELDGILSEEQDAYDNLPESLQQAERGEAMQNAIYAIDNAMSDIDGFDFDGVISSLEEASQ